MKYITGLFALNIPNSLNTSGDWHTSGLDWSKVKEVNSSDSILKDWGIEQGKEIPEHMGLFNVANDLRAILDIMLKGDFKILKGFRNDWVDTDEYNKVFFEKVWIIRDLVDFERLDNLMSKEFMYEWDKFKEVKEQGG